MYFLIFLAFAPVLALSLSSSLCLALFLSPSRIWVHFEMWQVFACALCSLPKNLAQWCLGIARPGALKCFLESRIFH